MSLFVSFDVLSSSSATCAGIPLFPFSPHDGFGQVHLNMKKRSENMKTKDIVNCHPPNRWIATKWEGPPIRKLIVDLLSRSGEGKVELRWIWLKILSLFTRIQFDQKIPGGQDSLRHGDNGDFLWDELLKSWSSSQASQLAAAGRPELSKLSSSLPGSPPW